MHVCVYLNIKYRDRQTDVDGDIKSLLPKTSPPPSPYPLQHSSAPISLLSLQLPMPPPLFAAFPPPLAVDVQHKNQSTILVAWQPPRHSRTPPLWFIVEWVCTAPYSHEEEFFWKKVPGQDTHTYIQGKISKSSFCCWVQIVKVL